MGKDKERERPGEKKGYREKEYKKIYIKRFDPMFARHLSRINDFRYWELIITEIMRK